MRLHLLALSAVAVAACRDATSVDVTGRVDTRRVPEGLEISNGTSRGIAFVAYNPNWLGQLALCADPGPTCVRLPSGKRVTIPTSEFAGWDGQPAAQQKLTLRWWHVRPAPGDGYDATDVHEVPIIP